MTTIKPDRKLAGTIFSAINRALKAEGFSNSEAYRLADRGARLLAAPETPELEAALRVADYARLPSKIKTAIDNLSDRTHEACTNLSAKLDGLNRSMRQTTWLFVGGGVILLWSLL